MNRLSSRCVTAVGLLVIGYLLGASGILSPHSAEAQFAPAEPSENTQDKLGEAGETLLVAQKSLEDEQLYVPAIDGLNAFAVTVGGVDAMADLKAGRGVDPETFAGLYSGLASPEIQKDLQRDQDGRLIYRGKLVKMYPVSRLKELFERRSVMLGEEN